MTKELLEQLKLIKENEFKFSDELDKYSLALKLLKEIGNHDPFIRDSLAYPTLANILYYDHLSKEELINITKILISDEGIKYDMQNYNDLSVLRRSFSVLSLMIIVYRHRKEKILSSELFSNLYTEFIDYFQNETDFRGYIDNVGWAHSVAHSADMFKQLFKCEEFKEDEFAAMFKSIQERFMINNYVFVSDEEERMVTAIFEGIKRKVLSDEYVKDWVRSFKSYEKLAKFPEDYNVDINIRNLLRSLYFRLHGNIEYEDLLNTLIKVIDELNTYKNKNWFYSFYFFIKGLVLFLVNCSREYPILIRLLSLYFGASKYAPIGMLSSSRPIGIVIVGNPQCGPKLV